MLRTLILNIMLVLTFDAFIFLNGQKKYRNYINLKHYFSTLKMPIYQKVLMTKVMIVAFLTVLLNIIIR